MGVLSISRYIRGCAADLGIDFTIFGTALGYRFRAFDIVLGHKISRFGIDLGQRQKKKQKQKTGGF